MADEIRADYDQLRQVATRFSTRANASQQTYQRVQRSMNQLQSAWAGRGSQAFFMEMTSEVLPALQRLIEALRRAQAVTVQISQIFQAAEEDAARPFKGSASEVLPPDAGASPLRTIIDALKGVMGFADLMPIPAAIALSLGLRAGATYPGQVLVSAPQLLKDLGISGKLLKDLAGVSGSLSHLKAINIATHISKVTKSMIGLEALIATGKGVLAVADVWERNSAEYAGYDASRGASARAVDAGLAVFPVATGFAGSVGGVLLGAKVGMLAGGALGSVIPVAGTAVGAVAGGIIGSAIGGFAGDWLGGKAGEGAVDLLGQHVSRDQMIDYVDTKIAQPIGKAVGSAAQAAWSWLAPAPQPAPAISF